MVSSRGGPCRRWQNWWNVKLSSYPPLLHFLLAALISIYLSPYPHSTWCTSCGTTGIYCCAEDAHCTSPPERGHCPDHSDIPAPRSYRLRNAPTFLSVAIQTPSILHLERSLGVVLVMVLQTNRTNRMQTHGRTYVYFFFFLILRNWLLQLWRLGESKINLQGRLAGRLETQGRDAV